MTPNPNLLAYFSVTGSTEKLALRIAPHLDASLYPITPAIAYTGEELRGQQGTRIHSEQTQPESRPELTGELPPINEVDMLIIGFPIWFGTVPRLVLSFLEALNAHYGPALEGKNIMVFATAGDSPMGPSMSEMRECIPQADWIEGPVFHPGEEEEILHQWLG